MLGFKLIQFSVRSPTVTRFLPFLSFNFQELASQYSQYAMFKVSQYLHLQIIGLYDAAIDDRPFSLIFVLINNLIFEIPKAPV